ncbi:MAG: N-acetylmuramoyl-L-alanine amidase [Candidatus Vogelbacteria bacterium]|nr:N-acetylmuramoyl-L-alanine amidase [Candidatus Vogelbacteria bacterium]
MIKSRVLSLTFIVFVVLVLTIALEKNQLISFDDTLSYVAGLFFAEEIPSSQIRSEYASSTLKLLIVPGHEKDTGGTEYKDLRERDIVLALSKYLSLEFQKDTHIKTFVTRDGSGDFVPWLSDYVTRNKEAIKIFRTTAAVTAKYGVISGQFERNVVVEHNNASSISSLFLHGINKYANDNNINLVLHLHFNDYPGRKYNKPGIYKGFAIYMPESQLPNANASRELALAIASRLKEVEPPSNYPKERPGLIEDQDLIAMGPNGTRDGVSLLVEYSYIYEKQLTDPNLRDKTLRDLAHATYLGVEDYFNNSDTLSVAR